jgi:hypothetical protein
VDSEGPYFISPAEISEALARAGTFPPGHLGDVVSQEEWSSWIAFLRGASEHGGCWVGEIETSTICSGVSEGGVIRAPA